MGDLETIIFDFDGTLGDTLPVIVEIARDKARKGLGIEINQKDIEYFRGMHVREIIKCIFSGKMPSEEIKQTHIGEAVNYIKGSWKSWWMLPEMLKEGLEDFYKQRKSIKLYDNIADEVNKLSMGQNPANKRYEILVLSSNRPDSIYPTIHEQGMHCANVYHSIRLFGKHHELKKIMRERGWRRRKILSLSDKNSANTHLSGMWAYDTGRILYVGDEVRDVHACQKLGVHMLGVTWGLNNEEALLKAGLPRECLIHKPSELLGRVEYLNQIIKSASSRSFEYVS